MFSTISSASPKPQFRAVILCGYGSDLYPLIETSNYHSDHDEDNDNEGGDEEGKKSMSNVTLGQVKALLPVAGKKMIDWVMERVEEAGVYGASSSCSPALYLAKELTRLSHLII